MSVVDNFVSRRNVKTRSARTRESIAAFGFLFPNLLGFLMFTFVPVFLSLAAAFVHWNIFDAPHWVGIRNFQDLLWFHSDGGHSVPNDPFFWKYVYNTVCLMIGVPVGMAGSLILAMLMNQKTKAIVIFRTIYFLPTVCSGVALLVLWKYLLNGDIGLINKSLRVLGEFVFSSPLIAVPFTALCALSLGALLLGATASVLALIRWLCMKLQIGWGDGLLKLLLVISGALIFAVVIGCGRMIYAAAYTFLLAPPDWLGTVRWAKPSLIIMGFWGGVGGYNMILYMASLQGVPSSYYEAAEIDGAGPWAKFWAITWPMISPTTFFILIMGIIGGLQSGFMTANVMTEGGPAGSTTTIDYYLYQTAFQRFNMGYASAIAWFLFAVILMLTLITWKVGGKVVTYD